MTFEKHFEEDDPYALVGVGFPCPEGCDAVGEMARTFIEEYALMGFTEWRLMEIFKNPRFQGPHGVLLAKGEEFVRGMIREVVAEGRGRSDSAAQTTSDDASPIRQAEADYA